MTQRISSFSAEWPRGLEAPRPSTNPLTSLFQTYVQEPFVRVVHQCIGSLVYTAYEKSQGEKREALLAELQEGREGLKRQGGVELSLRTPDGLTLSGMHFTGRQRAAILYLGGNNALYERDSARILKIHRAIGEVPGRTVHLLLLNPRGLGTSEGYPTPDGVALDVFTAFQYLVTEAKISPDRVVIYGRSIGGSFGTLGARLVQEHYPRKKIHVLHERSFVDLKEAMSHVVHYKAQAWHIPSAPSLTKRITEYAIFAFSYFGWDLEHKQIFLSLTGHKCIVYHKRDGTVPFAGSLYKALKTHARQGQPLGNRIVCIKLRDTSLDTPMGHGESFHNRFFSPEEEKKVVTQLCLMMGLSRATLSRSKQVKFLG